MYVYVLFGVHDPDAERPGCNASRVFVIVFFCLCDTDQDLCTSLLGSKASLSYRLWAQLTRTLRWLEG